MSRTAQFSRALAASEREPRAFPEVRPITAQVDMATTDALTKWAREHLATLSPARRAELENGLD